MIDFMSIWQHFTETSVGVIIFRILEKSCKKCQDENNKPEETITNEATTESNHDSDDSEQTIWDPAK